MRDPQRIDDVLAALRGAWLESPDLRLGQLLINAARPCAPCPEVFHMEDEELLRRLNSYRALVQPYRGGKGEGAEAAGQ